MTISVPFLVSLGLTILSRNVLLTWSSKDKAKKKLIAQKLAAEKIGVTGAGS